MKELAGNPGKRPLNRREPKPPVGLPAPPDWLKGEGRKEYFRRGRPLAAQGLMAANYWTAFVIKCEAWGRYVEAHAMVQKMGPVVKTAGGNLIQNPYLPVMNRALEQVIKLDSEFGLTPSSQSRVELAAKDTGPTLAELLFADVGEVTVIDGEDDEER